MVSPGLSPHPLPVPAEYRSYLGVLEVRLSFMQYSGIAGSAIYDLPQDNEEIKSKILQKFVY